MEIIPDRLNYCSLLQSGQEVNILISQSRFDLDGILEFLQQHNPSRDSTRNVSLVYQVFNCIVICMENYIIAHQIVSELFACIYDGTALPFSGSVVLLGWAHLS